MPVASPPRRPPLSAQSARYLVSLPPRPSRYLRRTAEPCLSAPQSSSTSAAPPPASTPHKTAAVPPACGNRLAATLPSSIPAETQTVACDRPPETHVNSPESQIPAEIPVPWLHARSSTAPRRPAHHLPAQSSRSPAGNNPGTPKILQV